MDVFTVPEKNKRPFHTKTPGGHVIDGILVYGRNTGHLHSGIFIEKVDGYEHNKFISGMPEIKYLEDNEFGADDIVHAVITDKLDGTALIYYVLETPNGDKEMIRRTRGMPVLQDVPGKKWTDIVREAEDSVGGDRFRQAVKEICTQQKCTLIFELWGEKNHHAVDYSNVPISMSLHTMIKHRRVVAWNDMIGIVSKYDIPTVPVFCEIKNQPFKNVLRTVGDIVAFQESQNEPYRGKYNYEGIVINIRNRNRAIQRKVKPPSMTELHRTVHRRITEITIAHAYHKMTEMNVPKTQEERKAMFIDILTDEYGKEDVMSNQSMINKMFYLLEAKKDKK